MDNTAVVRRIDWW